MPTVPSINPATGECFAETPATPPEAVGERLQRARSAQAAWGARSIGDRVGTIRRFQRLAFEARMELAELVTLENGKPLAEALTVDVTVMLDLARYYARVSPRLLRPSRAHPGNPAFLGKRGRLHWHPVGVVAVISPWNYPLLLPFSGVIPALIAGNAVLLKPSEFTTRTAVRTVELLHQAGVPPECCQLIAGGPAVGQALIDAGPDKIFFTGSVRTGRSIAVRAAERLMPVSLELGGSDPFIILADADLDQATSGAIWSRFTNGGQTCVAAKRIIVEQPAYEAVVALLTRKASALRLGPGLVPEVDVGPMIREAQLLEIEAQLAEAVARGARVLTGGRRRPDLGPWFFEPTVVVDVPLDSRLWREEVFGPVLPLVPAADAEAAIELANRSEFGLSGSIWTRDRARGRRLALRIETGAVLVNDATAHVGAADIPHGGEKQSGLGRIHGPDGLLETCRVQFVADDLLDRMHKPWWFGYDAESLANRDAFLRLLFAPTLWQRLAAIPRSLRLLRNRRKV